MEFFNFDPSELQILEDIEFDEAIQRAEKVRFYTLTEQTTDAYEKLMPRGRITRFQREETRKEIDRLKELYEHYVVALPEDYSLREPEFGRSFSWIKPVYAGDVYRTYDWNTAFRPLFENPRQPVFYPRLIASLPHPFADAGEGQPFDVQVPTEFVNREGKSPRIGLPDFLVPRTQIHEDKTVDILRVPTEASRDTVDFLGYYLEKRPLDIPNPFPEHPFLKANEPAFVESTAPLRDVLPSLDAILTHAVPVTSDPYKEADPYLKLYDIRLRDIPWSSWKSKFPPPEIVNTVPPGEPVEFPAPPQLAPPDNVLETYRSTYGPGTSVRLWLMNQFDGGGLIPVLLRSQAIENGSVESVPGVDLEKAAYPETTLEECRLAGKSFQDFMVTGVLRRTGETLQCVPLEFIKQERARIGYLGRKPWAETTGNDIKKDYIKSFEDARPRQEASEKVEVLPKTPNRPDSIRRNEVLVIMDDPRRFADDKLRDVQHLLKETTLTKNVYSDSDGSFVACAHTLAILGGDLVADKAKFYETWTARMDGFRVCKFCGEQINADVFVDQVQFDEDGMLIRRTDALEQKAFHGAGVASFTTGLQGLQPLFVSGNSHDETVYLLLSILQVLPTADKLESLLKIGRGVAAAQFSKGSSDQVAKFSGLLGVATTALLLQTHVPTLVPRRSFGTKPLMLSGYPRDADKPAEYSIVDSLLLVIRKTFEEFPTSFKGPAQQVVRAILNKPGEMKTALTAMLSAKSPLMKGDIPVLLMKSKAYHAENPVRVEVPKTLIPVIAPPKELGVINSFIECPSARPIWTTGRVPRVVQPVVPLGNGITSSPRGIFVPPSSSVRVTPVAETRDTIQRNLAREKGLLTRIPIKDQYRTNLAVASRISDLFLFQEPVRDVDPVQSESLLRDVSRGILANTLAEVSKDVTKRAKLEEQRTKDVALYTLLADYKEERANVNKLQSAERMRFVQRMAQKSDTEREIIQDLLRIGLAPYVITRSDREELAKEAARLQEEVYRDETIAEELGTEVGVGQPRDVSEQGEEHIAGVDHGDYGDYVGMPANDGRDYEQPQLNDDPERSI
jgi:hypothetical protein